MALKTSKQAWMQIKGYSQQDEQLADLSAAAILHGHQLASNMQPIEQGIAVNSNKLPPIHQETVNQQMSNAVF